MMSVRIRWSRVVLLSSTLLTMSFAAACGTRHPSATRFDDLDRSSMVRGRACDRTDQDTSRYLHLPLYRTCAVSVAARRVASDVCARVLAHGPRSELLRRGRRTGGGHPRPPRAAHGAPRARERSGVRRGGARHRSRPAVRAGAARRSASPPALRAARGAVDPPRPRARRPGWPAPAGLLAPGPHVPPRPRPRRRCPKCHPAPTCRR